MNSQPAGSLIKILFWTILFSVPMMSGSVFGSNKNSEISLEKKTQNTLVVLGDSLTEGFGVSRESAFPALLQDKMPNWKIINSGISGATTASAKGRISWILKSKPQAVLLILGANDGLRGLKVAESKKNLDDAILMLKKNKIKILLGGITMPPNYGKKYISEFENMYSSLSKKHDLALLPFILKGVAGNPQLNLADGIHPNEEGHKIIANTIYLFLKENL